jgi:hypothetical protein
MAMGPAKGQAATFSRAYAGARGTATGQDHPNSIDVTVHFLP